jgi:hypothetical protein
MQIDDLGEVFGSLADANDTGAAGDLRTGIFDSVAALWEIVGNTRMLEDLPETSHWLNDNFAMVYGFHFSVNRGQKQAWT